VGETAPPEQREVESAVPAFAVVRDEVVPLGIGPSLDHLHERVQQRPLAVDHHDLRAAGVAVGERPFERCRVGVASPGLEDEPRAGRGVDPHDGEPGVGANSRGLDVEREWRQVTHQRCLGGGIAFTSWGPVPERPIRASVRRGPFYRLAVTCTQSSGMSHTTDRTDGDLVGEVLSVADLLAEPQLAQVYAYLAREGEATVRTIIDELEVAQGTAYSYVNRLVDAGVLEVTRDEQPRRYTAREIDLTVTGADGERTYTITPALIDAVGRRTTDGDIDTHIDRYGVAGLATALTYAVARERGETTHRLMARDLDISPLAAEIILQALHPVVHAHHDIAATGASLDALDDDTADDA